MKNIIKTAFVFCLTFSAISLSAFDYRQLLSGDTLSTQLEYIKDEINKMDPQKLAGKSESYKTTVLETLAKIESAVKDRIKNCETSLETLKSNLSHSVSEKKIEAEQKKLQAQKELLTLIDDLRARLDS